MMGADYSCLECTGVLEEVGDVEYECSHCGQRVTEADRIEATAETVRAEGFDELAARLEAAAEAAREGV